MLVITTPTVFFQILERRYDDAIMLNLNANIVASEHNQLDIMRYVPHTPPTYQDFDNLFVNRLLWDDNCFYEFMRIMIPLYQGKDVFLLVYNEPEVFAPITECITKLIQQRYGYNYQEVYDVDDYDDNFGGQFTTPGILQFDQDMKRVEGILATTNPKYFIDEKIDDRHL